tara:strand:- start:6238 stop:7197 length:960 start_codon:yes stop_codon:yes gene_type:complete
MASLSGNKIKDSFGLLLKLASAQVSATEQVVQDGAGNSTALKLSTDTLETTGDLKISGTPATAATSDVTALMLSSSGVVVTRNLSTAPIGTASITANSPIVATGSTVGLDDPDNLSPLGGSFVANNDMLLIWDESDSSYKSITSQELADYVGSAVSFQQPILVGRLQANVNLTAEGTDVPFAEIYGDSTATGDTTLSGSSLTFGTASSDLQFVSYVNPRDAIQVNASSQYLFDVSLEFTVGSGSNSVTIQVIRESGPVVEIASLRAFAAGTYTANISKVIYCAAGEIFKVNILSPSSGPICTTNSTVTVTNLGSPNSNF